jgi:hypothetical protein
LASVKRWTESLDQLDSRSEHDILKTPSTFSILNAPQTQIHKHSPSTKMHSALVRIQNVFGFFTTVLSVVAGLIAMSSFFFPQSPSAELVMRNVQV